MELTQRMDNLGVTPPPTTDKVMLPVPMGTLVPPHPCPVYLHLRSMEAHPTAEVILLQTSSLPMRHPTSSFRRRI